MVEEAVCAIDDDSSSFGCIRRLSTEAKRREKEKRENAHLDVLHFVVRRQQGNHFGLLLRICDEASVLLALGRKEEKEKNTEGKKRTFFSLTLLRPISRGAPFGSLFFFFVKCEFGLAIW
jgi:hypothetical protein